MGKENCAILHLTSLKTVIYMMKKEVNWGILPDLLDAPAMHTLSNKQTMKICIY